MACLAWKLRPCICADAGVTVRLEFVADLRRERGCFTEVSGLEIAGAGFE